MRYFVERVVCFTGGLGSPRPYGREHPSHPSAYPQMSHPNSNPHPMMYPQETATNPYMYDQSGLQMGGYGSDRGRPGPPSHLQGGKSAVDGAVAPVVPPVNTMQQAQPLFLDQGYRGIDYSQNCENFFHCGYYNDLYPFMWFRNNARFCFNMTPF